MSTQSKSNRPTNDELRERFTRWYNAMQASHDILMASLRHKVGPDGDVKQAYRDWYTPYRKEHNEAIDRAHQRWLNRKGKGNGTTSSS